MRADESDGGRQMKFAGAYVPIEKPDKPRVRAVFDRHNGGPSDEYAEVFTAAEVRRPVNVGDPAQVYVDGVYAGLLDPRGRTASDRDNVVRLLAYLHSTGARKAKIKAAIEGYPNGGVDVNLMWDTDDDGVPLLDDKGASKGGCMGGAALVALVLAIVAVVLA